MVMITNSGLAVSVPLLDVHTLVLIPGTPPEFWFRDKEKEQTELNCIYQPKISNRHQNSTSYVTKRKNKVKQN